MMRDIHGKVQLQVGTIKPGDDVCIIAIEEDPAEKTRRMMIRSDDGMMMVELAESEVIELAHQLLDPLPDDPDYDPFGNELRGI